MRDTELRVVLVEEQRMARLAISRETDPLIETALGIRLVAVVAIELPAFFYGRNVRREMALVVETENIRVARFGGSELKFRMAI